MHHAVLETRVSGLETEVKGVKSDVARLADSMQSSHNALSNQISGLGTSMASSSQTDWKTLTGFGMLLLAIIGGVASLSKAPIDAAIVRADGDIREIRRDLVPRSEHQERWKEQGERFDRIGKAIQDLRKDVYVPRGNRRSDSQD